MTKKELKTVTVIENAQKLSIILKDDLSWNDQEVQDELRLLGVLFKDRIHAVRIIPRYQTSPCIVLGYEVDTEYEGQIDFKKFDGFYEYSFDVHWLGDLINILQEAQELLINQGKIGG